MTKKEKLKELLRGLTKEELLEMLLEDEEPSAEDKELPVHTIDQEKKKRRRGKGKRKRGAGKGEPVSHGGRTSKGKSCRTSSINTTNNRKNKFEDFMESASLTSSEKQELEAASEADKAAKTQKRTPRTRSSGLTEVECRVCGDVQDVSSATVFDISRWKCNECSANACG